MPGRSFERCAFASMSLRRSREANSRAAQKLPALNHRIQELARDSALWVNQLVRLIVANKRP